MSHAAPTTLRRGWLALAPKLLAFLATGLSASALIGAFQFFTGLTGHPINIPTPTAVLLVGIISTTAAWAIRDKLLELPPRELAAKVAVFALSSVTASGVVAVLAAFGIDPAPYSAWITAGVTIAGAILGYIKKDSRSAYALAA